MTQLTYITPDALAAKHATSDMLWVLETRRAVPPLALQPPGPSPEQLRRVLAIAARVPDHGNLVPWRFITVQGDARRGLAGLLAKAYITSNAAPAAEQTQKMAQRIEEVFSAPPLIVFVVSRTDPQSRIPEWERILSAGAACMNLLTAATAMGFGANWLTGWAAYSPEARTVIGLAEQERIAGFIPIGTSHSMPDDRQRPALDVITMPWSVPPGQS